MISLDAFRNAASAVASTSNISEAYSLSNVAVSMDKSGKDLAINVMNRLVPAKNADIQANVFVRNQLFEAIRQDLNGVSDAAKNFITEAANRLFGESSENVVEIATKPLSMREVSQILEEVDQIHADAKAEADAAAAAAKAEADKVAAQAAAIKNKIAEVESFGKISASFREGATESAHAKEAPIGSTTGLQQKEANWKAQSEFLDHVSKHFENVKGMLKQILRYQPQQTNVGALMNFANVEREFNRHIKSAYTGKPDGKLLRALDNFVNDIEKDVLNFNDRLATNRNATLKATSWHGYVPDGQEVKFAEVKQFETVEVKRTSVDDSGLHTTSTGQTAKVDEKLKAQLEEAAKAAAKAEAKAAAEAEKAKAAEALNAARLEANQKFFGPSGDQLYMKNLRAACTIIFMGMSDDAVDAAMFQDLQKEAITHFSNDGAFKTKFLSAFKQDFIAEKLGQVAKGKATEGAKMMKELNQKVTAQYRPQANLIKFARTEMMGVLGTKQIGGKQVKSDNIRTDDFLSFDPGARQLKLKFASLQGILNAVGAPGAKDSVAAQALSNIKGIQLTQKDGHFVANFDTKMKIVFTYEPKMHIPLDLKLVKDPQTGAPKLHLGIRTFDSSCTNYIKTTSAIIAEAANVALDKAAKKPINNTSDVFKRCAVPSDDKETKMLYEIDLGAVGQKIGASDIINKFSHMQLDNDHNLVFS